MANQERILRRIWRAPLVHFLAVGALLVAADRWRDLDGAVEAETLVVDAHLASQLVADFERMNQRAPTAAEAEQAIDDWIEEEMKVRAARRLGLHENDLLIRRRLVAKMEAIADLDGSDEAARYEQAVALGLDQGDLIIRRRLVVRLEQLWQQELGPVRADDATMQAYLEAHRAEFETPAAVRVSHVFVQRGEGATQRVEALGARLAGASTAPDIAPDIAPDEAAALGDPFLLGHHLPLRDRRNLAKTLGEEAADVALAAQVGRWIGPVRSGWGHHFLWVHERRAPALPDLDTVRPQILAALADEREAAEIASRVAALRAQHRIVIEPFDGLDGVRLADAQTGSQSDPTTSRSTP